MFQDISEYIKKSRDERREHLVLSEDCIIIGGYDSREYRGLLAHHLKTTIPTKLKVVLCHGCNRQGCSNPRHLYWGTYSDNLRDAQECGKQRIGKPRRPVQTSIDSISKKSQEKIEYLRTVDKSKWGWITKASKELKVSHTHVKRLCSKNGLLPFTEQTNCDS
jgi:hypothetical protein